MPDLEIRLNAIRGLSAPSTETSKTLSITDVNAGGYLEIDGETYLVKQLHRYLDVKWKNFGKRKKDYWVTELQLFNVLTGASTFLEWEYDDELEICLTLSQVKLRDILFNNTAITRNDIEAIAEQEHGTVTCKGNNFHYSDDDTWAALFYRDHVQESNTQETEPEKVRMYEFASNNDQYLTIELWENEDDKPEREAFISKEIAERSLKVLQIGAQTSAQTGGDQ